MKLLRNIEASCRGWAGLLFCCCILVGAAQACTADATEGEYGVRVLIKCPEGFIRTRSAAPDEDLIEDLNVYVLDSEGFMEDALYYDRKALVSSNGDIRIDLHLYGSTPKDIYVCANLGFAYTPHSKEELLSYRYHLSRPDDMERSIPMTGVARAVAPTSGSATIRLTRMAAKLTLLFDRRSLDEDVAIHIRSIELKGCSRNAVLFGQSKARSADDLFATGDLVNPSDIDKANLGGLHGVSTPINIYMLENFIGRNLDKSICPYIEIKCDYDSIEDYTLPDDRLSYRFYLKDRDGNYGIERNSHYFVTVRLEGKGLNGDSWRVDKSELSPHGTPYFKVHPATYIECRLNDKLHVWCDVYPPRTPFDIGIENLEFDRERGMFDYVIDDDGHGVVLHMKKKGTSMMYPEAGYPVNDEALIVIVCEP